VPGKYAQWGLGSLGLALVILYLALAHKGPDKQAYDADPSCNASRLLFAVDGRARDRTADGRCSVETVIVQSKDATIGGPMGGNSSWYEVAVATASGSRQRLLLEGKAQSWAYSRLFPGQAIPALLFDRGVTAIAVDGRIESTNEDPDVWATVRLQRFIGSAVLLAFAIFFFVRALAHARHHRRKRHQS
jgi:hypothetical protein